MSNLRIIDADSVIQTVKTTDNAGVQTPHHNVDSCALPTGAATEATLATAGATLADILAALSAAQPEYCLEVAAGNVSGAAALNKFGRNPDLDVGAEEDIWSQGGLWVPPTVARVHSITGGAADVATSGTGAWTVEIQGLNASFASVTETVNMNGAGGVNTANSYVIIHRMIVKTAGSGGKNAADIVATAAVDGTVTASIASGLNQTLMAIWQVPAGKTLFLSSYYSSINAATAAKVDLYLWAKPFGETWQIKHFQGCDSAGNGILVHEFRPPIKFTEKTIIRMSATTSANNTDISGGFDGIYR